MERAGDRLKKIRLEKGLSLEEVHKRTKIQINVLRAIEDDSFVNLNPVYVKGFLKIYCQSLGEDPSEYIRDYREPRQQVVIGEEKPQQAAPSRNFKLPALKLPVLKLPSPRLLIGAAGGIIAVLVLVVLVRLAGSAVRSFASRPKAARPAAAAVSKKTEAPRPAAQRQQPPVTAAAAQEKIAVPAGNVVRLGIRAKEDCWLQVRVDGKTVFQSVLGRGRLEGWEALNKIELTLGDAGRVELEVNGSRIPPLGRKGQVLRNVLITRDGLKVGK